MAESNPESSLTAGIRERLRRQHKDFRLIQRCENYNAKRLHVKDIEKDFESVTIQEMTELTNKVKKSCKDVSVLRRLKQGFSQSEAHREIFIRTNGAVRGLIGLLSGHDANVQLESAACFVNLFAFEYKKTKPVIKQASSYLVLYLQSDSDSLKELCAMALGNICADSVEACDVLKSQNFVSFLLLILERSRSDGVIVSSLYALGCYMTNKPQDHFEILNSGLEKSMSGFLSSENALIIVETAKIIFYLSTRREYDAVLLCSGIVDGIVRNMNSIMTQNRDRLSHPLDCQMLTFFLRTLAALCSEDETVVIGLLTSGCCDWNDMFHFLLSSLYKHIIKESLWFLSNIASFKTDSVINLFKSESLLHFITDKLSCEYNVSEEAIICLCNILELDSAISSSVVSMLKTNSTILCLLKARNERIVANTLVLISQLTKTGLWTIPEDYLNVIRNHDHDIHSVSATYLRLFQSYKI